MKRLLPFLLLVILIPQVTLAAWWNPFSWKMFKRTDIQVQVLENRIKELEKASTTTSSTDNKSIDISREKSSIKQTEKTPNIVSVQNKGVVMTLSELIQKYQDFQSIVESEKKSTRKISSIQAERQHYLYLEKLLVSVNADLGYLLQVNGWSTKPVNIIGIYTSKFNELNTDFLLKKKSYDTDYMEIVEAKANEAVSKPAGVVVTEQERECINSKSAYKEATDRQFALKEKYNIDVLNVSSMGSISKSGQDSLISGLNDTYRQNLAPITLDIDRAWRDMQIYCQ